MKIDATFRLISSLVVQDLDHGNLMKISSSIREIEQLNLSGLRLLLCISRMMSWIELLTMVTRAKLEKVEIL
jgi:hypothetical protein